jgi:hypothetical protein
MPRHDEKTNLFHSIGEALEMLLLPAITLNVPDSASSLRT